MHTHEVSAVKRLVGEKKRGEVNRGGRERGRGKEREEEEN